MLLHLVSDRDALSRKKTQDHCKCSVRKDRKKEMFVVMLIRYDCVTKESCRYGIVCR